MSNKYTIKKAGGPVPMTGDVTGPWAKAEVLHINNFPWYKSGQKQDTAVRLVYDDKAVYTQFICQDKHISAKETELHGPVCLDSCVEFFAMIDPANGLHYVNFEVNCCGNMHIGYGEERNGRILMTPEQAKRVVRVPSVKTPTKQESPADNGWWVVLKAPFEVMAEFSRKKVQPASGTHWKANFYRCGGPTDVQFGCWNFIEWEKPDFHRPEFFGDLYFE